MEEEYCKGVEGYSDNYDLPLSPTTADNIPERVITWAEALNSKDSDAWVCFWGRDAEEWDEHVWKKGKEALNVLKRFKGAITPSFTSTPDCSFPLMKHNIYRARAFAGWLGRNGISIVNGVSWNIISDYGMAFDALDRESMIGITTVGYNRNDIRQRYNFEYGLTELMAMIVPRTLLVYGPYDDPYFTHIRQEGVNVVFYDEETGLRIPEEKLPSLDRIPSVYPDFSAPIIPHEGLAGFKLGTPVDAVRTLVDAAGTSFCDGGDWYSVTVEDKVRLYFRREDDRVFQISAHQGYQGKLDGLDVINMTREEFFSKWKNEFLYDEGEEFYYSTTDGMTIDYDMDGNALMVAVVDEAEIDALSKL